MMRTGPEPFGYGKDGRPDEREQEILDLICDLREGGHSWERIADSLDRDPKRCRPRHAARWTRINLRKVARKAGIR